MNEVRVGAENLITTKELADALGVDVKTIQRAVDSLDIYVERVGSSHSMVFTKEQATAVKIALQNHTKVARNGFSTLDIANDLEAWELQKRLDAYKDRRIAELQAENEMQKQQLTEQAPKVETYNRISESSGLKTIKEVADILGYGEKTYFAILRDCGIIFRENGVNLPKREYINAGYFEVKEKPYEKNGVPYMYSRVFVTSKGLLWLEKKTPKIA